MRRNRPTTLDQRRSPPADARIPAWPAVLEPSAALGNATSASEPGSMTRSRGIRGFREIGRNRPSTPTRADCEGFKSAFVSNLYKSVAMSVSRGKLAFVALLAVALVAVLAVFGSTQRRRGPRRRRPAPGRRDRRSRRGRKARRRRCRRQAAEHPPDHHRRSGEDVDAGDAADAEAVQAPGRRLQPRVRDDAALLPGARDDVLRALRPQPRDHHQQPDAPVRARPTCWQNTFPARAAGRRLLPRASSAST